MNTRVPCSQYGTVTLLEMTGGRQVMATAGDHRPEPKQAGFVVWVLTSEDGQSQSCPGFADVGAVNARADG